MTLPGFAAADGGAAGKPRLLILYGSQTGNAQDAAERLGREAAARHFAPAVCSTASFPPDALPSEPRVVFVVSTTGQGDPPDSFRALWRLLLRKSLPSDTLARCAVAVFGMGDSGYPKFNVTAKKLVRRLEALGAPQLLPLGLGDDQHALGYEASLQKWSAQLWAALRVACPLPPGAPPDPPPDAPPPPPPLRLRVDVLPGAAAPPATPPGARDSDAEVAACVAAAAALDALLTPAPLDAAAAPPRHGPGRPCLARVLRCERLTAPDHFQEVRHLEFDLGADGPTYEPGDALAIAPLSSTAHAHALLERLGVPADAMLRVSAIEGGGGEFVAAARQLVRGALDMACAPPRRTLFELLARSASAPHEAQRLAHFGSADGRDELARYVSRERRSVAEVLADFPSAAPPLAALLQAAPRARARLYSISSAPPAPGAASRTAAITAAVVRWCTPLKRDRVGLLTPQLAAGAPGDVFAVWTERGALRLPPDPSTPLLMVGPGTGVAPFRAFVQARAAASPPAGPAALFFGCRAAAGDFLYAAEWAAASAPCGPLAPGAAGGGFFAAFSRDGPAKVYVTHALRQQGACVWRLLSAGCHVYVAGSGGAMPRDVFDALADCVATHGGMAPADAAAYLRRLEALRRYSVEVWS